MTIVIEPTHLGEPLEAVTVFPVRDHVKAPPPSSAWKASATRPEANDVGCPRSVGSGEKLFSLPGGSMVVAFGFEYPKWAMSLPPP